MQPCKKRVEEQVDDAGSMCDMRCKCNTNNAKYEELNCKEPYGNQTTKRTINQQAVHRKGKEEKENAKTTA